METKKSHDKNVERLRIPLTFSGLLFTAGMVLASFTYNTPFDEILDDVDASASNNVNYQQEEQNKPKDEPEQLDEPEYMAPPVEVIVIDSSLHTTPTSTTTVTPPTIGRVVVNERVVKAEPILFPDVEAKFPGGTVEMQRWIANNVVYPEISIEIEDQGKVYLTFVVEEDGEITSIAVTKGVSKELDREAKRVASQMPKWIPGEVAGKRVRTRCNLPIVFTLK